MKQAKLTFQGYNNGVFKFVDDKNKVFAFDKINNSLIHEFQLKGNDNKGKVFTVKYFVVEKGDKDILILSDLSL